MISLLRHSFVARLVAGFLLLSLLTVIAVSYIAYNRARGALVSSVYERLKVAVTLKENELNRWIEDQKQEKNACDGNAAREHGVSPQHSGKLWIGL